MLEKEFFQKPFNTEITVAIIGINRDDWYCHRPGMKRNEVKETMLVKGYDVVPIINKHNRVCNYFTLDLSDQAKLKNNDITLENKLYYLTHVYDAIWRMCKEEKIHYFLSNGKDSTNGQDIVGLLSLSNFNCREFYVYLFGLLSYVEREFASLIETQSEEGFEIISNLSINTDLYEQYKEIKKRWDEDKVSKNENDYKEYLYLHHLLWLIKHEQKYLKLGYKHPNKFLEHTSKLKNIRNHIAHPVKSLVRNLKDLNELNLGLEKLYDFKERLDEYKSK